MIKKILLLVFLFSCASSEYSKKTEVSAEKIGDFDSFMSMCKKNPIKAKKILESQEIKEQSAEHWGKIGNCYIEQRNFAKARLYLKIGESIDHRNSRIMQGFARLYMANRNYHKAYEIFQEIEKFNEVSSLKILAKLENYFGNHEKSNDLISRFMNRIEKNEVVDYVKLSAKNDIAQEDFSNAVKRFEKHQREISKDEEGRYLFAYSLAHMGELEKAKMLLSQRKPAGQSSYFQLYNQVQHFINTETSKKQMQEVHHGPASS